MQMSTDVAERGYSPLFLDAFGPQNSDLFYLYLRDGDPIRDSSKAKLCFCVERTRSIWQSISTNDGTFDSRNASIKVLHFHKIILVECDFCPLARIDFPSLFIVVWPIWPQPTWAYFTLRDAMKIFFDAQLARLGSGHDWMETEWNWPWFSVLKCIGKPFLVLYALLIWTLKRKLVQQL